MAGVEVFEGGTEALGQLGALEAEVAALEGTEPGPAVQLVEGVGDEQVGLGLAAGLLGGVQQLLLGTRWLQLELDEQAAQVPVGSEAVDEFGRGGQAQPQFGVRAVDFSGGDVFPGAGDRIGHVNAANAVIANGSGMDDGLVGLACDGAGQGGFEVVEGAVGEQGPTGVAGWGRAERLDRLGVRGEQDDLVAATPRFQGDGGAGATSENIGDHPHLVDGRLRVASGDEQSHAGFSGADRRPVELVGYSLPFTIRPLPAGGVAQRATSWQL